ncbi:hypothetical protein SLA2020_064320 [Shorea laevis]
MMNKISSIEGYDGCDPELVMQKRLLRSDLTPYQSRLLIPCGRYNNLNFLTHDELRRMEKCRESHYKDPEDDLRVLLVEPCLEETELSLRKWCSFGNHVEYFLTKGWWSVLERNELEVGDAVQLWKFRRFNQLCLALVIVEIENIEYQD